MLDKSFCSQMYMSQSAFPQICPRFLMPVKLASRLNNFRVITIHNPVSFGWKRVFLFGPYKTFPFKLYSEAEVDGREIFFIS